MTYTRFLKLKIGKISSLCQQKVLKIKECKHAIFVDISFFLCKNMNKDNTKDSAISYLNYLDY